jgi:hypothetical protein
MRVDGSTYQSPKYLCDPLVVVIASLRKCVRLLASGLQLWHAFVYRSPPHRCTYVHLHPSVKKERGPFESKNLYKNFIGFKTYRKFFYLAI